MYHFILHWLKFRFKHLVPQLLTTIFKIDIKKSCSASGYNIGQHNMYFQHSREYICTSPYDIKDGLFFLSWFSFLLLTSIKYEGLYLGVLDSKKEIF